MAPGRKIIPRLPGFPNFPPWSKGFVGITPFFGFDSAEALATNAICRLVKRNAAISFLTSVLNSTAAAGEAPAAV